MNVGNGILFMAGGGLGGAAGLVLLSYAGSPAGWVWGSLLIGFTLFISFMLGASQ